MGNSDDQELDEQMRADSATYDTPSESVKPEKKGFLSGFREGVDKNISNFKTEMARKDAEKRTEQAELRGIREAASRRAEAEKAEMKTAQREAVEHATVERIREKRKGVYAEAYERELNRKTLREHADDIASKAKSTAGALSVKGIDFGKKIGTKAAYKGYDFAGKAVQATGKTLIRGSQQGVRHALTTRPYSYVPSGFDHGMRSEVPSFYGSRGISGKTNDRSFLHNAPSLLPSVAAPVSIRKKHKQSSGRTDLRTAAILALLTNPRSSGGGRRRPKQRQQQVRTQSHSFSMAPHSLSTGYPKL
jgi:hypothetical protein